MSLVVNINGPLNETGYGIAFSGIVSALKDRTDVVVNGPQDGFDPSADIGILVYLPATACRPGVVPLGRKRAVFSMIEAESLPETWVLGCHMVDHIIVPSSHSREVFARCQKRPVSVCPLPVREVFFDPKRRGVRDGKVRLLQSGAATGRKNPVVLYNAFTRAYSTRKDVELLIRFSSGNDIVQLKSTSNCVVTCQDLRPDAVRGLYHKHDCFVYPSSGEGFCYPVLEAAATGMPVITTNCTAMKDYIDILGMIPISISNQPILSSYPPHGERSVMFAVTEEAIINAIDEALENFEAISERAYERAPLVAELYGRKAVAERLVRVIEEILNGTESRKAC